METDFMVEEIQGINDNAAKIYEEALIYKNLGRFLCKCDVCKNQQPDRPLWERTNFIQRGLCAQHMREQRKRLRLPPARKGPHPDQSYWSSEKIVAAMKREVMAALGEEAARSFPNMPGAYYSVVLHPSDVLRNPDWSLL
jgi:hypothetical protein